jgi:formylglycine-generating enzyme required for sulfatase activity
VSTFSLDLYEVTVGRFRKFVDAGFGTQASPPAQDSGANAHIDGSGWQSAWNVALVADPAALKAALQCSATLQTWTDTPGSAENRPMNCMTWYEAFAFCIWDGGRLHTEAEWNYSAAGGAEQRVYPWSDPPTTTSIDCSRASYNCSSSFCADGATGCAITDIILVGSKLAGNGLWGHAELAGNLSEWLLDWNTTFYPTPCSDCANLDPTSARVHRGGGVTSNSTTVRTSVRTGMSPSQRGSGVIGVRCARSP